MHSLSRCGFYFEQFSSTRNGDTHTKLTNISLFNHFLYLFLSFRCRIFSKVWIHKLPNKYLTNCHFDSIVYRTILQHIILFKFLYFFTKLACNISLRIKTKPKTKNSWHNFQMQITRSNWLNFHHKLEKVHKKQYHLDWSNMQQSNQGDVFPIRTTQFECKQSTFK